MTFTPCPRPEPRPRKPPSRLRRTALPPRSKPIASSRVSIARKVRVRPIGKSEGAKLRASARALASDITLHRAGRVCVRCVGRATDAMHIYGKKAHPRIRFHLANLLAGCRPCHDWLGDCKLAKPSRMLRFVLSLPGGRERLDRLKTAMSYPERPVPEIEAELRETARAEGVRA